MPDKNEKNTSPDASGQLFPDFRDDRSGPAWVRKRDGRVEPFSLDKLTRSLWLAAAAGGDPPPLADAQGLGRAVRLLVADMGIATVPSARLAEICREGLARIGWAEAARRYWAEAERKQRQARIALAGAASQGQERQAVIRKGTADWEAWWIQEMGLEADIARRLTDCMEQELLRADGERGGFTEIFLREWAAWHLRGWNLPDHAARLRVIGLPARAVTEIIRGNTATAEIFSPSASDLFLAAAIKESFTLDELLPPEAAAAHRGGSCHIHGLNRPEGYYRLSARLDRVAKHGFRALPGRAFGGPPKYGHTLLSQWIAWQGLLEPLSVEALCWPDAAEAVDRFMEGREESGYDSLALMAAYEFAHRKIGPARQRNAPSPRIRLTLSGDWGPRFSAALLSRLAEGDDEGLSLPGLAVSMDWPTQNNSAQQAACRLASGGGEIVFRLAGADRIPAGNPDIPPLPAERPDCLARVTLNLPRLAMHAGSQREVMAELDRMAMLAAAVGESRSAFLDALLDRGRSGPLGIAWDRERCPVHLDPRNACVELAADGLWDAALLLGETSEDPRHTLETAVAILTRLRGSAREATRRSGITVRAAANEDPAVSARFFSMDEAAFPLALAAVIERGGTVNASAYHMGISVPHNAVGRNAYWQWVERLQGLLDIPAPAALPMEIWEETGTLARFLTERAEKTAGGLMVCTPWK